jgi:hypothetical protein
MNKIFATITGILPDTLKSAMVLKALRWLSNAAGTALLTWLLAKGFDPESANAIVAALAGLILAVGSGLYSLWDAKHVEQKTEQKVEQATTTGYINGSVDGGAVAAIKTAEAVKQNPEIADTIKITAQSGSPEALKQLLDVATK